jgi:antitoxin component YwqK of YwqJK toxin-antitoxin module
MKSLLLLFIFGLTQPVSVAQIFRVDMKINHDHKGTTFLIKDTSQFEYYRNCSMDQGFRLKPNLPDGTYEVYINDTLNYKASYKKNSKNGIWIYYYPNGVISSKYNYKNGKKDGMYETFQEDGSLIKSGNYSEDKRMGMWTDDYSKDSLILKRYHFKNDEKIKEEEFYPNGNLKSEAHFLNGLYQGKNADYYENGKIKEELWYNKDKLTKRVSYDLKGNITFDKEFDK